MIGDQTSWDLAEDQHGPFLVKSGTYAQALFESQFPEGYTPKIDTRTPAQVRADQDEA